MKNESEMRVLHSHSGLEREMRMDQGHVLIDDRFKELFSQIKTEKMKCRGKVYHKVPVMAFVMLGGYFKNYIE